MSEAKRFDDLTLEEQDLVAMVRRLEANFGHGNVGILVFMGNKERQQIMGEITRQLAEVENLPYEGVTAYMVYKIPTDNPENMHNHSQQMHNTLQNMYLDVADQHFPGALEDEDDGAFDPEDNDDEKKW